MYMMEKFAKHKKQISKNFHQFLEKRNYGLMLNVDWFQSFIHLSNFSIVGGIYLVLLNYPRHLRFLRENVVLVGG